MSFSKAKIQRFNDIKAPTVPLKSFTEKPKPKIKTEETTHDKVAEKAQSDTGSSQSVPCFRTPTVIRKKLKGISSNQPPKTKSVPLNPDQNLEALKEKIVECKNKDAFIKDLTQQLEEYKEAINKIRISKQEIDEEREKFKETIDNLKNEYENKIKIIQEEFTLRLNDTVSLKNKFKYELKELKSTVMSCKQQMEETIVTCGNVLPEYIQNISSQYEAIINQKEAEIQEKENLIKIMEQSTIEMQEYHSLEIEKLRKEQQLEVQDLEFEMLKTMTELQKEKEIYANKIQEMEEIMERKIAEMRAFFESERLEVISSYEKRIEEMQDKLKNSNYITEEELKEKLSDLEKEWKNKLAEQQKQSDDILRECQAISEYNIIECEVEKNAINKELEKAKEELKDLENKYRESLNSLDHVKSMYEILKKETNKIEGDNEIESFKRQLSQALKEKAAYEFTIKNSQTTIDVLKRRLFHSDRDVEQLKEELAQCEKKLLEYEQKSHQLSSDLVQSLLYNEELEMQFESTIKLNCTDIHTIEQNLLKKVNDYGKEVAKYKKQINEEQQLKKEIMQQLHDAYDMMNKLKIQFESAENECSHYQFEIEQSHNELEDYHMREMDWNIIKDKLEFTIKELEDLLELKIQEIDDLQKERAQLKIKSDKYSESAEYYQQKIKELEEDHKETENIHKKYIEMSGKYDVLTCKYEELEAENLQNKMRLMKLSDDQAEQDTLKTKYDNQVILCSELEQQNENLKTEIKEKLKNERALKKELSNVKTERDNLLIKVQQLENSLKQQNIENESKQQTPKKSKKIDEDPYSDSKKWMKKNKHPKGDKENMSSPNRTLNSSRIDSPLRERN